MTRPQLERGDQCAGARRAQSAQLGQLRGGAVEQAAQAAALAEQLPTQVDRALPARSAADENCQQLGVGQGAAAASDELFTGTLVFRPVADMHVVRLIASTRH